MPGRIKLKHELLSSLVGRSRLSQNHWAIRLGLERGHFSQLVRGKRPYPNAATRRKLLDGLGLDFDELFEIEERDGRRRPDRAQRWRAHLRRPAFPTRETTMETLVKDFRYALRRLARSPGFALLAVVPLAVGIGANSTIFSFVNAALLRQLPAERPEEIRRLYVISPDGVRSQRFSYADYLDLRERGEAFSDLAAVSLLPLTLTAEGESEQVLGEVVSGNFFPALGIRAGLGRSLAASDDRLGAERVAVVSHALWQRRFGGDPGVLGAEIVVSGEPFTVVGVVSESFHGMFAGAGVDVWTPIGASARWLGKDWRYDRETSRFMIFGRLRPGFDDQRATAALDVVAAALGDAYPATHRDRRFALAPATLLGGGLRGAVAGFLTVATVMVGLVLLLACANIAHLLLARALDQRRETAVRLALGAGPWRLGRQLITESVVLALAGGGAGFLLALWSARLLSSWNPIAFVPIRLEIAPDVRVLAFTLAVSVVTGVVLGLVPLLQAGRRDLVPALKGEMGAPAGRPGKSRLRGMFLTAQIAFAMVLLIAAGLFLRSLLQVENADPGFEPRNALATDLDLEVAGLNDDEARRFFRRLVEHLDSVPGLVSASLADLAPLDLATARRRVAVDGHEPPPGQPALRLSMNRVAPGYFRTVGVPLVAGRELSWRDSRDAPPVAIVNQTLAERFWPDEDPLGQRFRVGGFSSGAAMDGETYRTVEVVGVARDGKYRTYGEEPTPHFYLPLEQDFQPSMTLLVRTQGPPAPMIATVQNELRTLHGDVQGFFSRTLLDHLAFAMLPARVAAVLFSLFGGVALVLAMVGIYGAVAYSVAGRTRELGIRVAMGAVDRDVVRLVLRQSLAVAGAGLGVGMVLALALGRLLSSFLVGVSATDPAVLAAVAVLVLGVVLVASYVPARRASRVDPLSALRQE